jgi:hypothetical protein
MIVVRMTDRQSLAGNDLGDSLRALRRSEKRNCVCIEPAEQHRRYASCRVHYREQIFAA